MLFILGPFVWLISPLALLAVSFLVEWISFRFIKTKWVVKIINLGWFLLLSFATLYFAYIIYLLASNPYIFYRGAESGKILNKDFLLAKVVYLISIIRFFRRCFSVNVNTIKIFFYSLMGAVLIFILLVIFLWLFYIYAAGA